MNGNPRLGFRLALATSLIAIVPGQAAYVGEIMADNPAGYWRLGDNAPSPAPDVAANLGTLGTLASGEYLGKPATAQPGALVGSADTATKFTGGQFCVVPYSTEINPAPPFTVECWAKPASLQTGANVVSPFASLRRVTPAAEGWIFYQSATGWNYRQGDSANNYTVNLTSAGTIQADVWYHLAATYDGSTVIFYVNGIEAGRKDETRYAPNPSVNAGIGGRGDNSFWFDGTVDEAAIYAKVLSPTQISAHYANGINASPAPAYDQLVQAEGPLAYWRLNEPQLPALAVALNVGGLGATANGTYFNGAFGGQPGAIAGDTDTAATFDGVNDKIDVPFNAGLNTAAYTFECWAKLIGGAGNHRSPISSRDDTPAGTPHGFIFYATPADVWEFWTGQGDSWHTQTGPSVAYDTWTHLVGTFDGTNKLFYVNGELVAAAARATPALSFLNTARPLRIGGGATEGAGNYFFNGDIDEVAVFNAALSPDRVYAHYKSGSGTEPAPVLPTVVADPQSRTNFLNQTASFAVTALGSLPFSYQWKFNGNAIPGAIAASYTIPSTKLADTGEYTVDVSNAAGPVTSAVATLTVLNITIPEIVRPPQDVTVYAGGTAHFTVEATGSPNLTYQWQFNGADLAGETRATLAVTNAQAAHQGNYSVKVTSEVGTTPSAAARLTVVVPPANSYPAVVMADGPTAFWRLGEASGDVALDYAGGYNAPYLNGYTLGQPGALKDDPSTAAGFNGADGMVEVPFTTALNGTRYTIECWAKVTGGAGLHRSPLTSRADSPQRGFIFYATPADQWEFWTGKGDSSGWDVVAGPSVIYDEWVFLAASYDGTTKRFYVNGREVGTSVLAYGPNSDKPLRIGAGATDNPTGNFFFAGDVDEVAIYPAALTPERIALHYGAAFGNSTPPSVTTQPISRAVLPGSTVQFSVGAAGSLPLRYQWQRNNVNLPNETNHTLTLTGVQPAAAGDYRAIVNNLAGTATSDPATLTVISIPTLPYSQVIKADAPVAYWPLNETSGEVADDAVGANDGMYMNGVQLGVPGALAGDPDLAAEFSAGNQTKVEVPFTPDLNGPVFSVECWARVTGGSGVHRSPLTSRADSPQRGYIFYADPANTWQFWTGHGDQNGWDVIQGPAVRLGAWAYLAATYDGTTKRFYVDGVEVGSNTSAFGPNDEKLLRIGGGATDDPTGNFFFEGSVDEAAVYATVLTPVQVLTHYAVGARPLTPPTLAIAASGANVVLTWSGGQLLESTAVSGAVWQPVTGANSPYTVAPAGAMKFYRVVR
jgi:hypothetical protein